MDKDNIVTKAMLEKAKRDELYQKFKKKGGFWEYLKWKDPGFFYDKKFILKELAALLEDVMRGNIKKLIISLPPRTGKSYVVSHFCAFWLGLDKTGSIMRNTCTDKLSEKFGLDIKNIITSLDFKRIFNVEMGTAKYGASEWALKSAKEYSYFGAGVGGSVIGQGCNLVAIVDDHIKNGMQAMSDTVLDSHYLWYSSTHLSRLSEGCPEILIGTRWSEDDIIGKVLRNESHKLKSGEMVYVNYPLLTSDGKSFCEAVKSTKAALEIKKQLIDAGFEDIWDQEYQQQTAESKDKLFPLHSLKFANPENVRTIDKKHAGYGDPADKGKDYFASMIAVEYLDGWFVTDVVYTQDPIEVTSEKISEQIYTHQPYQYVLETNKEGRSFLLLIKAKLKTMLQDSGKNYEPVLSSKTNSTNKETRIIVNSGKIKNKLYFRSDYKQHKDYFLFINHLTKYCKNIKNQKDDGADMCAGFVSQFCTGSDVRILAF